MLEKIASSKEKFQTMEFKKEQLLYCERNTPLGLYCVRSGKVKIYKLGSDGKEQMIRIASRGDFLGYEYLITGSRYTSSATVLEDTTLYFIPKQDFLKLLKNNEEFSADFLVLLCQSLLDTEKKMINIAYKPVRGRLAEALLSLNNMFGNTVNNTSSPISISRDDLANFIGTAKETAIRMLSEFKKAKLVATDGVHIKILNPDELSRISNFYN